MKNELIRYKYDNTEMHGVSIYDDTNTSKRPGIIVVHAWRGQDDFALKKAELLASLGYIAFAVDLYGDATSVETNEEAAKLMTPLFANRKELRARIVAAYESFSNHPLVDKNRMGAIGFCFGGLTVIELLRSGVNLKGAVSFHGLLGAKLGDTQAVLEQNGEMKGALLLLHGHDDPLVPLEDIIAIQDEMTYAKVDWQFLTFGHTSHAFTNEVANEPELGMLYNQKSSYRAFLAMENFFHEIFNKE